jgi:hypothetical protein
VNNHEAVSSSTRCWLENTVIGLNLCPFARRELESGRVRFAVTQADSEAALVAALHDELQRLEANANIETTLLIHPRVLQEFHDYNDFLAVADGLIVDLGLEGEYQVASFHPDYQFADTDADDVENYTNRSPYPILHLLREASLTRAVANYPDTDNIPRRNIEMTEKLGKEKMQALLNDCCHGSTAD